MIKFWWRLGITPIYLLIAGGLIIILFAASYFNAAPEISAANAETQLLQQRQSALHKWQTLANNPAPLRPLVSRWRERGFFKPFDISTLTTSLRDLATLNFIQDIQYQLGDKTTETTESGHTITGRALRISFSAALDSQAITFLRALPDSLPAPAIVESFTITRSNYDTVTEINAGQIFHIEAIIKLLTPEELG